MVNASLAIRYALNQIGKPYLWGATGPDSFDCSGLMVEAFDQVGVNLPRTTQQMLADSSLMPLNQGQLQPGDLVFPSDEHVQMYLGGGKVVEAPHTGLNVRITNLGTVYQARRVVDPASGNWDTGSSASPVSDTVPVAGSSGLQASDVSQMFGVGLTNTFSDVLQPILNYVLWGSQTFLGVALMGLGIFIIASKSGIVPSASSLGG